MLRFLHWLSSKLPVRIIHANGEPYLRRYYLFGKCRRRYFPDAKERLGFLPATYLHEFVRPDSHRDLHSHPWLRSWSLILAGGYEEERLQPDGSIKILRRRPGTINIIRNWNFHRISKFLGSETWSLFVTGKSCGTSYFLTKDWIHIPWNVYLSLPHHTFMDRARAGQIASEDLHSAISDEIDRWHESDTQLLLHVYLGMIQDEYIQWTSDPTTLDTIVSNKKNHD